MWIFSKCLQPSLPYHSRPIFDLKRTGEEKKGSCPPNEKNDKGVTYENTGAVNKDAEKQTIQNENISLAAVKKENQDEEAEYEIPDVDISKKSSEVNRVRQEFDNDPMFK